MNGEGECPGRAPKVVGEFAGVKFVADPSMAPDEFELRPGAVNYTDRNDGRVISKRIGVNLGLGDDKEYVDVQATTLVEFAELKGYKLGPWMKQQLQEIEEVGRRGLPNKG